MKAKLGVLGGVALVVWGLKRHYAGAGADDLRWILRPTAWLVEAATGAAFAAAPGEGYLSHERLFLIEKSCAGINFLIAAFGLVTFALLGRVTSLRSGAAVLTAGLLAGYAAAVSVNAIRIALAMWLAAHPVAPALFTAGGLHRLEGVVVYFLGLLLVHGIVRRLDQAVPRAECRT